MKDATQRSALAERAARAGGIVARKEFRRDAIDESTASGNGAVAAIERDAHRQILSTLHEEFPGDAFVADATATPPGNTAEAYDVRETIPESGRAWVVTPISGATNFRRGINVWTTSVAALAGRDPVGVATCMPSSDDLYAASPESVTRNDSSMHVSDRSDPASFVVGFHGTPTPSTDHGSTIVAGDLDERFEAVRQFGCLQGVLALVAAGSLDGAIASGSPDPCDALAGVHLVRRAGGTATDVHGDPWEPDSDGLVASNEEAHESLLAALRETTGVDATE